VLEADVMLAFAFELAAALGRIEGVQPAVMRLDDTVVPLQERLTLARGAGADLLAGVDLSGRAMKWLVSCRTLGGLKPSRPATGLPINL
jgi:hypothetical protein